MLKPETPAGAAGAQGGSKWPGALRSRGMGSHGEGCGWPEGSPIAFHDLISEIPWGHFCHILFIKAAAKAHPGCGEGTW